MKKEETCVLQHAIFCSIQTMFLQVQDNSFSSPDTNGGDKENLARDLPNAVRRLVKLYQDEADALSSGKLAVR